MRQEGLVAKNLKRLEKQQRTQKENEEEKNTKTKNKTDKKQKLLTHFILTKPRALHQATSAGNNIKEGCSSGSVGRGDGDKVQERTGDYVSLGRRQGPHNGSQETSTSSGRARLRPPVEEEGAQVSQEGRDGVKGTLQEEGRPGNKDRKRFGEKTQGNS